MVLETLVKVLLALVPRAVMAVMHTTIMRASMTAYSTAVGPSSRLTKSTTAREKRESITSILSGPGKERGVDPMHLTAEPAAFPGRPLLGPGQRLGRTPSKNPG